MVKFIADTGANHNGSKRRVEALVKSAGDIGCWAVKPQIYKADRLFRGKSPIPKKWEFDIKWLHDVRKWCDEYGMKLFVSVFYEEAVKEADCADGYKISSFDIQRLKLIKSCMDTGKPVFISTGLATMSDIARIVIKFPKATLFHCVSEYPAVNAELIKCSWEHMKGYSDHTRSPGVIYKAATMVEYIEFHLDLDGKGWEAKTTDHCWNPSMMQDIIFNLAHGEAQMKRVPRGKDYYNQKADPEDGLRRGQDE